MAIQISGTTIIDDYKRLTNIGGKGGIISGTFTVGGPQGFGSIRCNVFRGHVIGFVSFDNDFSQDNSGTMAAALGWSIQSGSDWFNSHTLKEQTSGYSIISPPDPTNPQFQFQLSNYYPSARTAYYSFWYSGSTVPTVTII